jgi:iron complex outermembrane receptor protein
MDRRFNGSGAGGLRAALAVSTALAAALGADRAFAQAQADATASVEEVVVTAQKRAEKLQEVPVSVSALSGSQLASQRITKVDDIVSFAPGLKAQAPGGDAPIFSLRGISMADYSSNQSGPVATYFDEVYKGVPTLLGLSMYDLERIEVLRGPQGTLYGKNTTGGAINIISKKPTFENGGDLSVGFGNYNHWQGSGDVNLALSDQLATRFAFTADKADGFMKNRPPGRAQKLFGTDGYAGRLSVLAKPTDKAEFILRVAGSYQHPWNYGIKGEPTDAQGVAGEFYNAFGTPGYFPKGLGKYDVQNNKIGRRELRTWSASLTGNIELPDSLTVTSITSWDWGKSFVPEDTDGTPLPALEIDYAARARQIAQDLRLTSNFSGPFNFIFGGYFNRERTHSATANSYFTDIDYNGDGVANAQDCLDNFLIACTYANSFTQTKTSLAVYTDLKYALTDHLTLRGGLRYTHDKGRLSGYESHAEAVNGTVLFPLITPGDVAAEGADRFSKGNVSGKIGLDYKTSDGQLYYVSASRGYRGNAFNAQGFFAPQEVTVVRPETLNDFEAGAKLQLLDHRLILNLSAFYYDYKDMQFLDVTPDNLQVLVNVPKARVYGAEAELMARPTQALSLRMGLGLLDSEIRKGELRGEDLKGHQLATSPHVSLTLGADWTLAEISAGTVALHADSTVTSKQYFDVFNRDAQSQKAYALVNGSLSFQSADHRWGASIWAKNLLNKFYYTYRLDVDFIGENYQHPGAPRTFGATLNYSF